MGVLQIATCHITNSHQMTPDASCSEVQNGQGKQEVTGTDCLD